jgi:hypothetical protein
LKIRLRIDTVLGIQGLKTDDTDFDQPDLISFPDISRVIDADGNVKRIWCLMWTEKKFDKGELYNKTYCTIIPEEKMTEDIFDIRY